MWGRLIEAIFWFVVIYFGFWMAVAILSRNP